MLFRCARCKTRYRVDDHLVQGRRFRVTCKACGAVLMANAPASNVTPPPSRPHSAPKSDTTQEWYVAIKKKQRGPLNAAEVSALIADRTLSPRSYIWKPGMPEWVRLGNLDVFHDALVVQRAQMALSEPSYAAYMAKVRGEDAVVTDETTPSDESASEAVSASMPASAETPVPKDDTPDKDATDSTHLEPQPRNEAVPVEISDPRQSPKVPDKDSQTDAPEDDISATGSETTPPFDDSATIADEPIFTRDDLKRIQKKGGFRAMDTQISAPPDMDDGPALDTPPSSTVDDLNMSDAMATTAADMAVEGYEGQAEPFPPFAADGPNVTPDSQTVDSVAASVEPDVMPLDGAAATVNPEAMTLDVASLLEPPDSQTIDEPIPMDSSDVEPPPQESEFKTVKRPADESHEPITDEQEQVTFQDEAPTSEDDDASEATGEVLEIDDLLEASIAETRMDAPPVPPPAPAPPTAAPQGDKLVHRQTDEEMLVLEGNFFDRAESHLEQDQALEQALSDRMDSHDADGDHREAAMAPVTDDELDALTQSLSILVRREKQSRRVSLAFSLLVAAVVIGVGVAGASSGVGDKKNARRSEAKATNTPSNPIIADQSPSVEDPSDNQPRGKRQRTERVTDMDWEDGEDVWGKAPKKKRSQPTSKMTGSRSEKPVVKRKKPATASDRAELSRITSEDNQDTGLVLSMKSKPVATAKKRNINNETISKLISARMRHFRRCSRSNMPGMTVKLVFNVTTEGNTSSIRVTPSTGPDRAVENCVRNIVKKWRLPAPETVQTFRRTLVF